MAQCLMFANAITERLDIIGNWESPECGLELLDDETAVEQDGIAGNWRHSLSSK